MSKVKLTGPPIVTDLSEVDLTKGVIALTSKGVIKRIPWDLVLKEAKAKKDLQEPS